ncbi:MAG: hypothetical protein WC587_02930 [Candidatus Paceibacterota bacterium]
MADEELKQLLQKNLETSQESLEILKKMNRARMVGNVLVFLKWVVIIGLSYGAYYFIEPYLKTLTGGLDSINSGMEQVKGIQNLLPR